MRKLTYENSRGETIEFYQTPFVLEKLSGIGEVDASIQGQSAPYQDGDAYIDTTLEPRFITMEAGMDNTNSVIIKQYRKQILRVCNPKLGLGKITLELDGDIKEILGTLDGVPFFPEREVFQRFMITWKCPNPYWKDPQEVSRALRAYQGGLTLPYTLPYELAITGDSTILVNEGDVETPVQIDIQGPVTNPKIINKTTGEFILMNMSVAADEILHIDTTQRAIRAEIYREGYAVRKVLGRRDATSDFWQLELGENEIQFIADAGANDAAVAVSWQNRYVGI